MEDNKGIKSWAESDRPYEKLLDKGARALSDSELLAIFIKSGTKNMTALDAAKKLLSASGNKLDELGQMTAQQIVNKKIPGIGKVKALNIVAALELGRRRREETALQKRSQITSSNQAFQHLIGFMENLATEEFWVLLLDRSNKIIRSALISKGGISGTVVDKRVVFKMAIEHNACGIIMSHNHPSGNLKPSKEDIKLTEEFVKAGSFMDIPILDHLIIAGNSYFSFADEGYINR